MGKVGKIVIGVIAILGLVIVAGRLTPDQPEHGCSDQMDAMLTMRHDGEQYREAFCNQGGEARAEQVVKDIEYDRTHGRPAF